jgi:hypothetical protein
MGRVKRRAAEQAASDHIGAALARLRSHEQSLLAGRARLEMALELRDSDWAGAVSWARGALMTFERIGASLRAYGTETLGPPPTS